MRCWNVQSNDLVRPQNRAYSKNCGEFMLYLYFSFSVKKFVPYFFFWIMIVRVRCCHHYVSFSGPVRTMWGIVITMCLSVALLGHVRYCHHYVSVSGPVRTMWGIVITMCLSVAQLEPCEVLSSLCLCQWSS